MAVFDLKTLLLPYGDRVIKVKAKATGYTDSGFSNSVTYHSAPIISRKDGSTLTIANCRAAATSYEIYKNGTLVKTVSFSGSDGDSIDVDISSEFDNGNNNVYVKGVGTGVSANQSPTLGFWKGNNIILGVSGLYASSTSLTRTDAAEELTWALSSNKISSDFDDYFPYNQMLRKTHSDDANIAEGEVFVYIPAMYWRIGYDSNGYITDIAVAPAAMEAGENQVIAHSDAFYYGAYGANVTSNLMYSKSGVARTGNLTRANFRSYAKARGDKYRQLNLYHMRILDYLFMIEFATKSSDTVMQGYTSYGQNTGATDSFTAATEQASNGGRMRWRYIEDFIGNGLEFFDGMSGYKVTDDESSYNDASAGDLTFGSCSGYFTALKIDPTKPLLSVPQGTGGGTTTYFGDSASFNGSAVYYRGRSNNSADCGLFYLYNINASSAYANIGSRLIQLL